MCRAHQENSTKLNQPPTVDVYIGTKQKNVVEEWESDMELKRFLC